MSKKIVTFDFDSTLSHKIVQDFAKSLMLKDVEVNEINSQTDTKGIDVTQKGWKKECLKILEL